ncbi:MAG TPA: DUF6775 family putative metallopeptidase [Nitrososphaeraceae archaeon]
MNDLVPIIETDVRSFAFYFRKNKGEDAHAFLDTAHLRGLQNSSCDIGQKIISIDGFYVQRIYSRIINKNEMRLNHLHVIFEDNLLCTHDGNDEISC